jgi:hypothetical protein
VVNGRLGTTGRFGEVDQIQSRYRNSGTRSNRSK